MEKLSRSDVKRQSVLSAALAEFKLYGFQGASMDAIAERAQVSKRTVYNHFASKEILFDQATQSVWQQIRQAASLDFDPQQPLAQQLAQIARQSWVLYQQPEFLELSRVLLAEYIRSPELAQTAISQLDQQECGLLSWLEQACAAGLLQIPDLQIAETQFWGLFKAFAFWPAVFQFYDYSAQQQQIIDSNVALFLSLYQTKPAV